MLGLISLPDGLRINTVPPSCGLMPRVSAFHGITISIFYADNKRHSRPHFHAYYAGHAAVFSIPEADILVGSMPNRQYRYVVSWATARERELVEAWEEAVHGRPFEPIAPLT